MAKELTHGSPARLIFFFSLPLLCGNAFQQIYSMVDTIIVGRTLGVGALAGVGATGSILFLILGFVIGMATASPSSAPSGSARATDSVSDAVFWRALFCVLS